MAYAHSKVGPIGAARAEPIGSLVIFYVAIPLALAFLLGAASSGSGRFAERWAYFAYWLSGAVLTWGLNWAVTWLAAIILRPWRPPLLGVTTLGAIVALHLSAPLTLLRYDLFAPYLLPGAQFYSVFPFRYDDPHYVMEAVIAWATSSIVWGVANSAWVYFLGFSRFGYQPTGATDRAAQEPHQDAISSRPAAEPNALTSRLPADSAQDIIALRAEQHYTRVYSRTGDTLILMRFSDAVQSLGQRDGLQVHRSYWVRPSAVHSVEKLNGSYRLELVNGMKIPVGGSFKREFHNAGVSTLVRPVQN